MSESIAHYRLGAKLGQGGMGEVYRATDTRLGRDVALKRISPQLSEDAARMANFTREAQVLASLNHPNIATIYGIEGDAIVMELVEGPTLAERIAQGPLPLDEALAIARQIADGLAAAHDKGIVHRDLKPANIKITPDGTVKLLDFGLAKAAAAAAAISDEAVTVAFSMTGTLLVGTPGYMAPEQARGQPVDKRADIWAFGVILYEMLTGAPLFQGETTTDILAAVVKEEPDFSRVPPVVRPLLRRCLEKDPRRRLRDIGDAMLLVETASTAPAAAPPPRSRLWQRLPWAVAAALALGLGAVSALYLGHTPPAANTVRFRITLPAGLTFTQTSPFALSPDGRMLAFPAVGSDGVTRLWIHPLDALEPRPLLTAETGINPSLLTWSPDSRAILYFHDQKLKRVDVAADVARTIADVPGPVFGGAWHANGTIVFGTLDGIVRMPASGGPLTPLTASDRTRQERHEPQAFLPDGRRFLYSKGGPAGARGVYIGNVDAPPGQQPDTLLLHTDFSVRFVPSHGSAGGQLLYVRDGTLVAQDMDVEAGRLIGEPVPVGENVFAVDNFTFGVAYFSVSNQGTLVYRTGTVAERLARQLTWFGRDGTLLRTLPEVGRYNQVKISPDGTRAVTSRTALDAAGSPDLWVTDFGTETSVRFTFNGGNIQPVWSPDSRFIAWGRLADGGLTFHRKRADGSGDEEVLYRIPQFPLTSVLNVSDWSANGRFLIYALGGDVFALPIGPDTDASREPIPIVATPATEFGGTVSPDMRWIAYVSNETGRQEVYIQPFAPAQGTSSGAVPAGGKWMVSRGTLGMARWRRDGRELIFLDANGALMSVEISPGAAFRASPPRELFQLPQTFLLQAGNPGALADATRDLQRLVFAMPTPESARHEFSVVLNWPSRVRVE